MKYRMLGVDLDGTLLDSYGKVSAQNLHALRRAQDAGLLVVPCTGRAWRESHRALAEAAHLELGVFVTGAAISEMPTGHPLDTATMDTSLAWRIVQVLQELPEAVLIFRDAHRAGHDYLVTGRGKLSANTRWWFDHTRSMVHHQPTICEDDLLHTLRVGMVAGNDRMARVLPQLRELCGDQIVSHAFAGINLPDQDEQLYVLEVFARGVDKWRGLQWIARQHNIADDEIAVIGDGVNDLSMFATSSCAIAMGNAIEPVRHAARYITLTNDEHGVAHAIDMLLTEKWQ
jgi:HAD superfamily hydrolase (TIGR01484 family)